MFMNNTGARIAFGLLVFFVGWNPENAFGGDPDAWVGYQVCSEENRPGTYEYEEFVFFLVEVDITTTEVDEMHWEGEAMLAMGDAIRSYLTDGVKSFDIEQIPYKGKIREQIRTLIQNNSHASAVIEKLRMSILVNERQERIYRYVAAVKKKDLERQKLVFIEDLNKLDYLVLRVFQDATASEQHEELAVYYLESGLVEDALYFASQRLSSQYHLVNFYHTDNPYRDFAVLRDVVNRSRANEELDPALLQQLPGNAEILSALIRDELDGDPLGRAVATFSMLPDTDTEDYQKTFSGLKNELLKLSGDYPNIKEYIRVLDTLAKLQTGRGPGPLFSSTGLMQLTLKTFGHLRIDTSLAKESNTYFQEASTLFQKGQQPDRIEKLLVRSLAVSPRHLDSWEYLGALLFALGRKEEALVTYNQLYQLDRSNLETMAHIAECYYHLGFPGLARSHANHLEILNANVRIPVVNRIIQMIVS